MDPDLIAKIIKDEIDRQFARYKRRAYYRGVVESTTGQRCNVRLEGSSEAMPNLLCLDSYTPAENDEVLVANIGTTGSNFIVLGSLTLD